MAGSLRVDVEIFVSYTDSVSSGDELSTVVDYNVMRDALLEAGNPSMEGFVESAFDALFRAPLMLATIEVRDHRSGAGIPAIRRESRKIRR